MRIEIDLPDEKEILKQGIPVSIASRGNSWFQSCLGQHAKAKGVYIFHHNKVIKYVGKTNGPSMTFGIRLRRHLQESAAGKRTYPKHTYPKFADLSLPPSLMVTLLSSEDIKKRISHNLSEFSEKHMIEIFEDALIAAVKPEFQT